MPLIQKDNIHDGHNHEETILKGKGEVGGEENKEREEEKEEEEEEEGERVGGRNLLGLEETPSGRNKVGFSCWLCLVIFVFYCVQFVLFLIF